MASLEPSHNSRPLRSAGGAAPSINPWLLRFFRRIVRSYFRRHFRSVMVQGGDRVRGMRGPLIVYANHSSWWDPMTSILLAAELFPGASHYAPMEASALTRYPLLAKLGLFPVELSSTRGAVQFLRSCETILAGNGVVWITPQGCFTDPRRKPLVFRSGLGALARRFPDVPIVPMAIEYTFWDERLPEALSRFGSPVHVVPESSTEAATAQLEEALRVEMAGLETASCAREAPAFVTVLTGARGSGGIYGTARRLRAWITGKQFDADHTRR